MDASRRSTTPASARCSAARRVSRRTRPSWARRRSCAASSSRRVELPGILLSGGVGSVIAQWIVDGVPPVDVSGLSVDRTQPHETTRRFRADRTVEQLGASSATRLPDLARRDRPERAPLRHPRPAGRCRRALRRSVGLGVPGVVRRRRPDPARRAGLGRNASFDIQAEEHRAVREAVGMLDMSLMAKFLSRAATPSGSSTGSAPTTSRSPSGRSSTRSG